MSPAFINGLKLLVYETAMHKSEASFKKLFVALFPSLYRFSRSMLQSKEQAEEVASDVMFKIWQHRMDLLHVDNIQVYALAIARNQSLNLIKKNARAKMTSLGNPPETNTPRDPENLLMQRQQHNEVEAAIEALPTRCRLVFRLIREEGMSYKEVGEVLNISSKTVDAHLVTAMKKLTDALNLRHF